MKYQGAICAKEQGQEIEGYSLKVTCGAHEGKQEWIGSYLQICSCTLENVKKWLKTPWAMMCTATRTGDTNVATEDDLSIFSIYNKKCY